MKLSDYLNWQQMLAAFWKLMPLIAGILIGKGWLSQEQFDYIMQNQSAVTTAVGGVIAGVTVFYTFWKNRPNKRAADVANDPGKHLVVEDAKDAANIAKIDPKAASSVTVAP